MLTQYDLAVIDFAHSLGIESEEVYKRCEKHPKYTKYRDAYTDDQLIQKLEDIKQEWVIPKLYHERDPITKTFEAHRWPFVYIHLNAEDDMMKYQRENNWEWGAPDLFVSDQPMPKEPGRYPVEIYGKKALAVIDYSRGKKWLSGRVSYLDDKLGLRHCKKPEDWR
ncbi:hypothetical protein C4565_00715 [Candidatus Parcubacteria bacterium]|nr:MAG: hypothetical protein C4565_00715 [Candidatus Parcubacteria bacterium]